MNRSTLAGCYGIVFCFFIPGAFADVLGVPAPFATIQSAIDAADPADTVLVEPGTYVEEIDFLGKAITVMSSSGPEVTIIQGISASVATFQSAEGPDSILDGFTLTGGSGNQTQPPGTPLCYGGGVFIEDASPVVRNNIIEGNDCDCCPGCELALVSGGGMAIIGASSPLIENNTIRNNEVPEETLTFGGAGIYCSSTGVAIIRGNLIANNRSSAGGGISTSSSSPRIEGNTIRRNGRKASSALGGGIMIQGGHPIIEDNLINWNEAIATDPFPIGRSGGGGIYCFRGSMTVRGNVIVHNVSPLGTGGGVDFDLEADGLLEDNLIAFNVGRDGGGVRVWDGECTVRGNRVVNNTALECAGGIFATAGLLENNEILDNTCEKEGGGLRISGVEAIQNIVEGNSATESGGGIYALLENTLIDNEISNNSTSQDGGGIWYDGEGTLANNYITGNHATSNGGGLWFSGGAALLNNTVYENLSDGDGGGIFLGAPDATARMRNTLLWGNSAEAYAGMGPTEATIDVTHSNIQGGWPGEGNLDVDPFLSRPSAGRFRPRLGSPMVDAGTADPSLPPVDPDGDPRSIDGNLDTVSNPDIGADELVPEIAALFGTVDAAQGEVVDVLTVNETAGDHARAVNVESAGPIVFGIAKPPAGGSGKYVIHANVGAPNPSSMTALPASIGWTAFPLLLADAADPVAAFNNIGKENAIGGNFYFDGETTAPPPNAPADFLDLPAGDLVNLPPGFVFTIQGVIIDPASLSNKPASVTNGLVVTVE